jgi:pilus assembly protein CpaB
MSNSIKLLLLVVVAALFAVVARSMYLASASSTAEPKSDFIEVAAADLPEGLLLRDGDLDWKAIPRHSAPSGAIVKGSESKDLHGAMLRHAVAKSAVITADDVIASNDPGFLAAILKPGMRAISVAVDAVSGNAGLIQPGDYVDLLLTQQLDHDNVSRDMSVTSETVVQRVRVLAVGSDFQRPKNVAPQLETRSSSDARTVTLEVTAHRAEVIAVAAKLGSLSLALRSFARDSIPVAASEDAIEEAPPPVYAGEISRAARPARVPDASTPQPSAHMPAVPAAPAPSPEVRVFRGSDKNGGTSTPAQTSSNWGAGVPPLPSSPPPLPTMAANDKPTSNAAPETSSKPRGMWIASTK